MKLDPTALELAQTHHYSLGTPRNIQLINGGKQLLFARSSGPTDMVHDLWTYDVETGKEHCVFNVSQKLIRSGTMTDEEQRQRERLRETSTGITHFDVSDNYRYVCFTLNGKLWVLDLKTNQSHVIQKAIGAFDAHFSPDSQRIGYVNSEGLWVTKIGETARPKQLAANESPLQYWGRAEFIAAEEFDRQAGYWWAPDGQSLIATHVNEEPIQDTFYTSTDPFHPPASAKYPAAGTDNAEVSLFVIDVRTGDKTELKWDKADLPYVLRARWRNNGIFITLQSRDQKRIELYKVAHLIQWEKLTTIRDKTWVEVLQPLPFVQDDAIVSYRQANKRQLLINKHPASDPEHHVEDFIDLVGDWTIYTTSPDPKERVVFAYNIKTHTTAPLSPSGGVFTAVTDDENVLVVGSQLYQPRTYQLFSSPDSKPQVLRPTIHAKPPKPLAKPHFFTVGREKLEGCLLLPKHHYGKLPVLMQVYGGPHAQVNTYSTGHFHEAQWWVRQGYAVLMVDGPGTPGRDTAWEQMIHKDLISPIAQAHMFALKHTLKLFPELDARRVAVRGWSFGGYLSAFLSVLYPQYFHASISGAPVTDWRLYDTHYTERYLGLPAYNKSAYDHSSLVKAATTATRPILLIHGLGDDNVLFANSLQLIQSLNKAACTYTFMPLQNASHFTKQAEQSAALLQAELDFLKRYLV